jgi:uncharacterized protein (DUF433 family)
MTAYQKLEQLLPTITPAEKARFIVRITGVSTTLFPGIEKNDGICGGSACVIRTRVPVWTLVAWKKSGLTDDEILSNYPTLIQQDLENAWGYYLLHPEEIETEILENEED